MTYSSSVCWISRGVGKRLRPAAAFFSSWTSSRMMSLQSSTHSLQTNTEGPAISLWTSCWLLPQNEQYRSFSPLPSAAPGYASPAARVSDAFIDHGVDQAVSSGLAAVHEIVAVRVFMNLV